jgi:hypothetical protein
VAANSRFNIWVDLEPGLADEAVSTTIVSTNGVGILVERAMWWPTDATQWFEAHNSSGSTQTGTRWAFAEGEVGGANGTETYILIANTSEFTACVSVTLLFEDGPNETPPPGLNCDTGFFLIPPHSRFNLSVGDARPVSRDRRFGAIVQSHVPPVFPSGKPPAQIVVERAMYSNSGGVIWAAGSNSLATRLP